MIVRYFFFFIILTFYACSSNENVLLELALDNSGENRSELEAVLDHYKDNQKKQEAARFLISNMIGKQVLDSNSVKGNHVYFDAFANYRETYGSFLYDIQYAIYDSINKLYSYTKVNPRFLSDLKELSSDYLIHHIDQCFQNKERYPWCKNMDWDIFFDYVLPYTTDNCHWEHAGSYFDRKYASLRDSMYMCSYEEIGKAISDEVEQGFLNEWIIFTGKYQGLRPMTFQNIVATQMGTCLEKSTYKIAALRANGIPAALNMVPCWGNSQYPHSWVEIIGSKQFGMIYDNTQRPFLTKDDIKIDGMFWRDVYQSKIDMFPSTITIQYCRTAPKVYRYNYRIQPHSLAILSKEEIPPLFKNPGIQDITDQYVVCEDIEVPLWNEKHPKEYVYLCCYDIIGWNPVCWGRPEGSKVRFPKMGVNMLYLPAYYNDGEIRPAGDAFILTREGKLRKLLPDFEKAESSATFYSKVPYRMNTALQAAGTIGTRFYVCNKKDLSDRSLIYSIENPPFYVDSFRISVSQKYRYLICDFQETQPLGYFYAIAEIKVFGGDGQQFSGEWGGNEGTKGHGLDLVTDQDRVSYYQPVQFQKDQFVVLDLGEPKQIAKVEFYPRNDDNKIVTGELYELFYWDKKWISLGKQYAEDNKLIYQNIPRESIFRIHNHTRGKEHRPFTYEGGKQVWY